MIRKQNEKDDVGGKLKSTSGLAIFGAVTSYAAKLAFFVALLLIWQEYTVVSRIPAYILPSPTEIYVVFLKSALFLSKNAWVTFSEAILGFALGTVAAIALAFVVVYSKFLRSTIVPLVIAYNSFPVVAIAPLLVVWFGLGLESKIVLGALLGFFPVTINMITGLGQIEPDMLDLVKVVSASEFQISTKIRLPNALPNLFDGLRIALPLSLVGAIIGEFVGSSSGLGYQMGVAQGELNTPLLFAALVFLALISLGLYAALVAIERIVLRWRPSERNR